MSLVGCLENHDLVNRKAVALSLLTSTNTESLHAVDWERVKALLQSQPIATEKNTQCSIDTDPMGRLFLVELVSRNAPPEVVELALIAYPDALLLNVSCFFTACQHSSPDVLRVLTRHIVQQQANSTDCPFPWIAMNHVSAQGAKVILEEYPQGALQGTIASPCPLDRMLFSPSSSIKSRKISPDWFEKVKTMLMVAEYGSVTVPQGRSFHTLNALIRHITRSKPQIFADPKESKDFLWLFHQLSLLEPRLFTERDQDGDYALHAILRGKFCGGPCIASARNLIYALIQAHLPSARLATHEGRIALHLALENGWPCHDLLLQAAPDTLQLRDAVTGLYPFQTAAAACSSTSSLQQGTKKRKLQREETTVDVIYQLLRQDPVQVAQGFVEGMLT